MQEGRGLLQYSAYGNVLTTNGGVTDDSTVGWGNLHPDGFNVVEGVVCPAGQQTCHGRLVPC